MKYIVYFIFSFHQSDGKIINFIENMYAEIKSCILLNVIKSECFNVEKGVRNGENLSSPLIFSCYLNDLETAINDDQIEPYTCIKLVPIIYADDTMLMSDDEKHFQNLLNHFAEYCKRWHLKIYISKTKIMIFDGNARSNKLTRNKNARHIFPHHYFPVAMIGIICLHMHFVLYTLNTRSIFFKYLHYFR